MHQRLYRVIEVAQILGCGRTTVYAEIKAGRLRAVHVAGCSRVVADDLDEYITRLRDASEAKKPYT